MAMESILLMGSNEAVLKRLKGHLIKHGFRATMLGAGDLEKLEESKGRFILGIVDVEERGVLVNLVSAIRAKPVCKELPILLLLKNEHLKELPGVSGVEDFLIAPVDPELLETRIRFVLKRLNHLPPGTGIRIGALALDPDRYELTLDGEPLELTYKEFELFKFLATHPGRVYSRDQLLNQVWGYDFIGGTRTVDVHIRRLRAKLGPKYASLIDTVRNVGYKFLETL